MEVIRYDIYDINYRFPLKQPVLLCLKRFFYHCTQNVFKKMIKAFLVENCSLFYITLFPMEQFNHFAIHNKNYRKYDAGYLNIGFIRPKYFNVV